MADAKHQPAPEGATGLLALADGSVIWGRGFGAEGEAVGEVCFNTAMTGYQEIMTDPSYAAQIVTFTFPHIGNVGANYEDLEADNPFASGCVVREDVTAPTISARARLRRMDACQRPDRAQRRRHAGAHPQDPHEGAPNGVIAYREEGSSIRGVARQGARLAGPRRDGPRERGLLPANVPLGRRQMAARRGL